VHDATPYAAEQPVRFSLDRARVSLFDAATERSL